MSARYEICCRLRYLAIRRLFAIDHEDLAFKQSVFELGEQKQSRPCQVCTIAFALTRQLRST